MTWAQWVLIIIPPAWVAFLVWIARGGLDGGECDEQDFDPIKWLDEEWLPQFKAEGERLDRLIADYQRKQQPVREACELTDEEETAWQRIQAEA